MALRLEPTPKTGAIARDFLNQCIYQAADDQQWQTHIYKYPQHKHKREAGFFQAMTHHGFGLSAKAKFVQHDAGILGA